MKYVYLCFHATLLGFVIFLMFHADHKASFPFGGPTPQTTLKVEESGDKSLYNDDIFHVGYMANNGYRENLALIGVGIAFTGALGWFAIGSAQRSKNQQLRASGSSSNSTRCETDLGNLAQCVSARSLCGF